MIKGTIVKGIGGFYYVKAEDDIIYECKARGVFRKKHITPTIGDKVLIEIENGKGFIEEIQPRRNKLVRPSVANVDTLVIVVATLSPEPDLSVIDKMLVNAHINDIEPVICLNKTDIGKRDDIIGIYKNAGYTVLEVSAIENSGIDELKSILNGKVTAFAGLSGVGKSSILSIVTESRLEIGKVSDKIQRGKHTTRHTELFEIDKDSYVLDTPGFGSLETESIDYQNLWQCFPEMHDVNYNCRFRGCSHINEPDCAVKKLIEEGKIAQSRYESYKEIYAVRKSVKAWQDK